MSSWSSSKPVETAISLLESVYGQAGEESEFPRPMPVGEAGLCADQRQRRYLWTDAFGVLAYVSLIDVFRTRGNEDEVQKYEWAAHRLVDVVHECLGKPRSTRQVDAMKPDNTTGFSSPTGLVGLRIGKVDTKLVTDYGMRYDGQYWHYIDKWLLALTRLGRIEDGVRIAKTVFPYFFFDGSIGHDGGGIRWKLSVDATPPPELRQTQANEDTLSALIVYSILENARCRTIETSNGASAVTSLEPEIQKLRQALQFYKPRVTDDPLGWGLEAFYDQFLRGHPRQQALSSLSMQALHPSHLSLPFRLYGAIIGARLAGPALASPDIVDRLVELSLQHQAQALAGGHEEHSSINRVMLAMCLLCPGALARKRDDPVLNV